MEIPEYEEWERPDTVKDHRDAVKMAYSIYVKYYKWAKILEIFAYHASLTVVELRKEVIKINPPNNDEAWLKEPIQGWDLTLSDLFKIGLLSATGVEEPLTAKFSITSDGLKSVREGIFFNLANSAFFGYRSLILGQQGYEVSISALETSKSALKLSKIALGFTTIAVLIALFSIVLTLCR
jgi:hypothetical protein